MEDTLILTYNHIAGDKPCLSVSKHIDDRIYVCQMIIGEDATKIYELLKGDLNNEKEDNQ